MIELKNTIDQINSLYTVSSRAEIESVGLGTDQYNLPNVNNKEKIDLRVSALHSV